LTISPSIIFIIIAHQRHCKLLLTKVRKNPVNVTVVAFAFALGWSDKNAVCFSTFREAKASEATLVIACVLAEKTLPIIIDKTDKTPVKVTQLCLWKSIMK